jgi:hypothetical protein
MASECTSTHRPEGVRDHMEAAFLPDLQQIPLANSIAERRMLLSMPYPLGAIDKSLLASLRYLRPRHLRPEHRPRC